MTDDDDLTDDGEVYVRLAPEDYAVARLAAARTGETVDEWAARLVAEAVEDSGPVVEREGLSQQRGLFNAALDGVGDDWFTGDRLRSRIEVIDRRLAVVDRPWETQPVVVALDVDGVLNRTMKGDPLFDPDWQIHNVVLRKALLDGSPFIRGYGKVDVDGMIAINPALHGSWINRLLARGVDVVWATTWQEAANDVLPPLLGIPELPVAVSTRFEYPQFGYAKSRDSAAWKAQLLQSQSPGRRIIWIDDNGGEYLAAGRPEPTHLVRPEPSVGLTAKQMRLVDRIVDRHLAAQAARPQ